MSQVGLETLPLFVFKELEVLSWILYARALYINKASPLRGNCMARMLETHCLPHTSEITSSLLWDHFALFPMHFVVHKEMLVQICWS